jgi:hypothetical protein
MTSAVTLFCCLTVVAQQPSSVVRTYSGVLSDIDGENQTPVLEFNITCLATEDSSGAQLDFMVVQDAATALPWHGRFGRQLHQPTGEVSGRAVEIQFAYEDQNVVRELMPLILLRPDLDQGFEWTDGAAVYTVTDTATVGDRECWVIEGHNRIGYYRTLQLDQESGALVAAHESVFLGQGDEFSLELRLNSEQELDQDEITRNQAVAEQLLTLQSAIGESQSAFPDVDEAPDWPATIEQLRELAAETQYANLVAGMSREYEQASRRAADVSELADAIVGQSAPDFSLELLGNGQSVASDRENRVVVLHFWNYRDDPLEEPYGQVGYLDFLSNRLRNDAVTILGVAVNQELAVPETRPAAIRSIRGLQQFMNLGYLIGLDNGEILETFGDPRTAGVELPLWIVIGPDGKVVHYHAGLYDIDVNRGLEDLETEIRDVLPLADQ